MILNETFNRPILFIPIFVITLTFISGCANDTIDPVPSTTPTGPKSQYATLDLYSEFVSESYPLRIFLPAAYETNKNLPVIYILLGKLHFDDFVTYTLQIGFDAIIVGVGRYANKSLEEWKRDFTPGFIYNGVQGGHLNYYKFLTQEVVPYIDENYENDQDFRSLIGWSATGTFTLFSLLHEAQEDALFHGFLASDPQRIDQILFQEMLETLEFSAEAKNIRLFISESGFQGLGDDYHNILGAKDYPWLDIDYEFFEHEDSLSVVGPSFKQGLKFIYSIP